MSSTTTNIGLVKPAGSETYDVSVQNGNMDKIDQTFGKIMVNSPGTFTQSRVIGIYLSAADKIYIPTNGAINVGAITFAKVHIVGDGWYDITNAAIGMIPQPKLSFDPPYGKTLTDGKAYLCSISGTASWNT